MEQKEDSKTYRYFCYFDNIFGFDPKTEIAICEKSFCYAVSVDLGVSRI